MLNVMSQFCVTSTMQRAFVADLLRQIWQSQGSTEVLLLHCHTCRRQEWLWLLIWKALSTGLWRWKEPDTDPGAVCRPLCISVLAQWLGRPIIRARKAGIWLNDNFLHKYWVLTCLDLKTVQQECYMVNLFLVFWRPTKFQEVKTFLTRLDR